MGTQKLPRARSGTFEYPRSYAPLSLKTARAASWSMLEHASTWSAAKETLVTQREVVVY